MQIAYATIHGHTQELNIPDPDEFVVPGVLWGVFDELRTPAYWHHQAWQHDALGTYRGFRFGNSLVEETAACLLGGYGMPAEIGVAAFLRLRDLGLLTDASSVRQIESTLLEPLRINGRVRKYRFARQKSKYLVECLRCLQNFSEPRDDRQLRDALTEFPGIGLKTASWIVRNYRASNAVAIIDVHIMNACTHIGLFPSNMTPQRHYLELEDSFLGFAAALDTPAALLDSLIWDHMRRMPI